jgi:hypothetical protein
MVTKMPKGEHEAAMEKAKYLLRNNVGMEEIIAKSHLTVEEINKARSKM